MIIKQEKLEIGAENEIKRLEKEIEELNYKRSKLSAVSLAQLISKDNVNYILLIHYTIRAKKIF